MQESGTSVASGASNGVGSRGPLKGPLRGPGAEPRRGSRGQRPLKLWVLAFVNGLERLSWKYFFSLNQPRSGTENVSIKRNNSLCRVNFRPHLIGGTAIQN